MKKKYTIWYDAPEVKEVVVYNEADAIKAFDNATREECVEELLSSMDSFDISEFLAHRVSLSDIIEERMAATPRIFMTG